MKILFIASRFPYPPIQGDRVRGYHHLRVLSQRHQITLIAPAPKDVPKDHREAIESLCEQVHLIPTPFWRRLLRLIRAPFTSLPLQTLYVFDPRTCEKARQVIETEPFDLMHVQLVRMAPVITFAGDTPAVMDFIDALSLNMARRSQRERGPMAWIMALEARRVHQYEQKLTQQYSQLIVSSPLDRDAIGDFDNIHIIPNGVSLEDFSFAESERMPGMIVFTGRMGYYPNVDATTWFAAEVLPLVRRQTPQTRFFIVGADPIPAVRRLERYPGVTVTGYVPRIQDYLARASVAVAPMQGGSGMQFKVLEAMSCGAPVVATPLALGGIEAADGEHLLLAQDAEAFAERVIRLLRDQALGRRLARNARRLVEEKYTWERALALLENVYRLAAG